ncbi:MAG: CHAT domain-containing protein [Oscillatoria princeps RMCB-10]|jgi:filamentous hemagglutinin family protein|nr:CHAT domain-containing protein [Oscillatoria princeps RMCB-10]
MKPVAGKRMSALLVAVPVLAAVWAPALAQAQTITPAPDGTGTAVTPQGNTINIQGGSLSRDGANLFHSFQKFGLSEGQIANFLSNPDIRNILGRVVGGDASYINGLIRVSGGNSNLFLMNPAGILFGPNASLNVPADFTATAATGIGLGSGWFNAAGSNDHSLLVGTPSAFSFALPQPGAIVNEGNLTLTSGNNLTLLGGTVINTGTLTSPGGNITIAAVPGDSAVRISQEGHLLSLDIEPVALEGTGVGGSEGTQFLQMTLPQLLTGRPDFGHASALSVNQKGEVSLTGSGVRIPAESGTAVVAGNIDVSAPSGFGGGVSVLGSRVALAGASINASGALGGGTALIGGDDRGRSTGILPVPSVHPLNASHTFVSSDSVINADALLNGDGGKVVIWSDKTTHFLGHISARGGSNSGNGGVVGVSGKDNLIFRGTVDVSAAFGTAGTLLLGSENITIADKDGGESDSEVTDSQVLFEEGTGTFTISEAKLESLEGNADVKLEATDNITVADLSDKELTFKPGTGTISLTADADKDGTGTFSMNAGDTIRAEGRSVTVEAAAITAGNIDTSSELGDGGAIALNATSDIVTGSLLSYSLGTGSGGEISINSSAGGIDTAGGELFSYSMGNGGSVTLKASGDIKTGNIGSSSNGTGNGGNIALTSRAGGIDTVDRELNSSSGEGNGGSVTLTAFGDIQTGFLSSDSWGTGSGGNIALNSSAGGIDTAGGVLSSSSIEGNGGSVTLTASGDIKTAFIFSNSYGTGTGGNIALNSSAGGIDTAGGMLDSSSIQGNGGSLTLSASGIILTGDINSSGFLRGGDISITSQLSDIINKGFLGFSSESGTPGTLTINAYAGSISTGNLSGARNVTIAGGGKDDAFSTNPKASVTAGAEKINTRSGNVTLVAHSDITVNEPIQTDSITSLELIAGRSININAGIDTSGGNGNITLRGNDSSANLNYRDKGPGSVTMAPGTALNAGSGNIVIELGRLAEVGSITLSDINTAGALTVNATTGNILRSSADSLITAGSAFFGTSTSGTGGIGLPAEPLRVSVSNLEAMAGSGGAFFESPELGVTVGGATALPIGIIISGGSEVSLRAAGDITIAESVSTASALAGDAGNITLNSTGGIIDSTASTLNSSATQGNGGSVTLTASGEIKTGDIKSSSETGSGGNISLNSSAGGIDTALGWLSSSSYEGNGGAVTLTASGDIKTGNVESYSSGTDSGGNIEISSSAGGIDTTGGMLSSYSTQGNGGAVTLTASGDINTREIDSFSTGTGTGGNIALNSSAGGIDTTSGRLSSFSVAGNGGAVTLTASGDIQTGYIASMAGFQPQYVCDAVNNCGPIFIPIEGSTSTGTGGDITVESSKGAVNTSTGPLNTMSSGGAAGSVTINAAGHVETAGIRSEGYEQGGNLSIRSDSPNSIAVGGNLDTYSTNGTAGDITLSSPGRITLTGDITSYGSTESGDITVTSDSNTVTTNSITTQSGTGPSGNITINGNNIAAGNLDSIGRTGAGNIEVSAGGNVTTLNIQSRTDEGDSGNIAVEAGGDISTGDQTTSTGEGNSGNIANTAGSDVTAGNQTASSGEGNSGNITNTAGSDVTAGNQTTSATNGNSGNITNTAGGNVTAGNQTTSATNGNSGNITNTAGGNINTGNQTSSATGGTAGSITNSAGGSISTGNLTSAGTQGSGEISLNSGTGEINTGEIRTGAEEVTNGTQGNPSVPALNSTPIATGQDFSPQIVPQNSIIESVPAQSTIITTLSGNSSTNAGSNSPLNSNRTAQQIVSSLSTVSSSPLAANATEAVALLEQRRDKEFADYFGQNLSNQLTNPETIREALATIASQTGNRSAIIYVTALPDELELVVLTPEGKFTRKTVPAAKRDDLLLAVWDFRDILSDREQRNTTSYLQPAQQLYQWLIAPIEAELQAAKIDTLLFSMDAGLRSLPVAALHDGKQFLVEKYSLALIPSVSLMDTRYQPVQGKQVLAMGASEFTNQQPLPAVPVELDQITHKFWQGKAFLNQDFTRDNLMAQRSNYPYPIIHLATHGEFKAGKMDNSYIQLWNDKLRLDELRNLRLNNPPVELLVLSACRTALGDEKAELGFAGFAVAAGVKTAVASLWYVSDAGTLGLMTEFYDHLTDAKIKAEALRLAQLAMIRGEVRIEEGELRGSGTRGSVSLPAELRNEGSHNLKHPYYWSGFTMIGSPW